MARPSSTVHIIDDDDAVRDALRLLLEIEDIPVQAHDSVEAFLAAPQGAACVVTDLRMPGLGGAGLLRELGVRRDRTPVIVIAGYAEPALAARCRELGAYRVIEKPFSADEIVAAVRAALAIGGSSFRPPPPMARQAPG
jgi:FixJ family two-component response regulator